MVIEVEEVTLIEGLKRKKKKTDPDLNHDVESPLTSPARDT